VVTESFGTSRADTELLREAEEARKVALLLCGTLRI
jgi:hypothetical protein